MEARYPRPSDSHVAQRSRRDKMRVAGHRHHSEEFPPVNIGMGGQRMLMLPPPDPDEVLYCPPPLDHHPDASQMMMMVIHRDAVLRQLAEGANSSSSQPAVAVSLDATGDPRYSSGDWTVYDSTDNVNNYHNDHMLTRQVSTADLMTTDNVLAAQPPPHHLLEVIPPVSAVASELNVANELALLPAHYGKDVSSHRGAGSNTNARGLSLTLSSNPGSSSMLMIPSDQDPLDAFDPACSTSASKFSVIGKKPGKSIHEVVTTAVSAYNHAQWSTGPLGPFTGYATILKSSKFLKPAQDLLDELCTDSSRKPIDMHVMLERISAESYMSSSTGGGSCSSTILHPPEDQQKRATLLHMQDEICRQYKHYYQQMHMVVSSFETVAGLSFATPYISLALKTVARNFRCLKNALSNQLRNVKKSLSLRDDLLSPNSKGDLSLPKLATTHVGQSSFTRNRSYGANMGFLDPHHHHHHVWRPQRGLPERAVAVLRAWLFEHFLHPYPTDMDKHVLASRTGLSRNQVSNWFINARVRLWKPMVEEIHALETKRLAEANPNSAPTGETSSVEVSSQREAMEHTSNWVDHHPHMASSAAAESRIHEVSGDGISAEQWNQELHSRLEGQLPLSMEAGPLIGFMRYPQGGVEFGGIRALSLSLGLRHNAQWQENGDPSRQQFGGQMMHCDFDS